MQKTKLKSIDGFSLLELTVGIIILGILLAVAMQSMTSVVNDVRQTKTEREMEMLASSIVGDADLSQGAGRGDFGYVGDIGAFPPNLNALYNNPGGYSTWKGPYLPQGFTQDSTGLKTDEWGAAYNFTGGMTITSTGSGSTITKKIARATADYLINTVNGDIADGAGSPPGSVYGDSINIQVTIPNGTGGTQNKLYKPNSLGNFTLDSIPVGQHPLRVIYTPLSDTLFRYLTVYPRHKSSLSLRFASTHFTSGSGGGGCDSSGTIVLRPSGNGSITNFSDVGCFNNWQCVDEVTSDGDNTRVIRASISFATDVYNIQNPATTSCPLFSVTVYCMARRTQSQGEVMPTLYLNGTEYNGTMQSLTSSYAIYSHQWTTNPNTSAVWTISDINSLQAGVRMRGQNSNFPSYCTQVWIEVAY